VDSGGQGARQATCSIQVGPRGSGSCDVTYQASEVSGRVKIRAETTDNGLDESLSTQVDVRVPSLFRASGSPQYLRFVRSKDSGHVDAVAFALAPHALLGLQRLANAYRIVTVEERSDEGYTLGLILSVNDMSLPWGGKFDITGEWTGDHNSHRKGTSIDINKRGFDRLTDRPVPNREGHLTTEEIERSRLEVSEACDNARGRVVPEEDFHCEFDAE